MPAYDHVAFQVSNIDAAIQTDDMPGVVSRLQRLGVPILRGPLEIPGEETWLYFTDPDNNILEYIQWFHKKM